MANKTSVYKTLSWEVLLAETFKFAIQNEYCEMSETVFKSGSLKRSPATEAAILAAEERLQTRFPDDYRQFLLTSNGLANYLYTGVTIAPVEIIDSFINVNPELIEIWEESDQDGVMADIVTKLKQSILIGGGLEDGEEQYLLLNPLPGGNWECIKFATWMHPEAVYESFRAYMEEELKELEEA